MREWRVGRGRRWRRRRKPCGLGSSGLMLVVLVSTAYHLPSVPARERGKREGTHEFNTAIPTPGTEQLLLYVIPINREDLPRMLMPFPYRKVLHHRRDEVKYPTGSGERYVPSTRRPTDSRSRPLTHSRAGSHVVPTTQRRTDHPAYRTWIAQERWVNTRSVVSLTPRDRQAPVTHTFSTFIPPCPFGPLTPSKLSLPFPTSPKFADPVQESS